MYKVVHACKEIYKARGVYVPGLANGRTAGHSHTATAERMSNNHDGKRDWMEYNTALTEEEMHEDLKAALRGCGDSITAFFRMRRGNANAGGVEQP